MAQHQGDVDQTPVVVDSAPERYHPQHGERNCHICLLRWLFSQRNTGVHNSAMSVHVGMVPESAKHPQAQTSCRRTPWLSNLQHPPCTRGRDGVRGEKG